ncbi:type II secretion system GspH family protein [Puniceicoccaceae bacterium K14]|nr:type II secretion system GspH family protein [Puniceicoccaceae bacterium K14]
MINEKHYSQKSGFTLIEIMIVLLMIGVLASVALPGFAKVRRAATTRAFSNDIKALIYAAECYELETGYWLPHTNPGVFPAELDGYYSEVVFESPTSVGGNWAIEFDGNEIWSGLGIVNPTLGPDYLELIDQTIDDGNLNTGQFRQISAGKYFYVLEEI